MLKMAVNGLLIFAILGCVAGVATGDAFVYILWFLMLVAATTFGLLVLVVNLIWKLLPEDFKKNYEGGIGRFNAINFFPVLLFFIVAKVIDETCLPEARFISLLGYITTFIFVVFLRWCLIRRSKGRTMVAGSVVFISFIALLSFVTSIALKSGKITGDTSIKNLSSLPYLQWAPAGKDIEKAAVVQYNPELAFDGINLYSSRTLSEAYLIDMHGNIVHKWATKKVEESDVKYHYWHHVEMCKNGDLLVPVLDQELIRLDWDSRVKWKQKMRVHHDVAVDENKKIYVLVHGDQLVFWNGIPVPILGDDIVVLSADGEIEEKIHIYPLVKEKVPLRTIVNIYKGLFSLRNIKEIFEHKAKGNYICRGDTPFDILHTNTIEIMDRDIDSFCKQGDLLISIRQLDIVGVVDVKKEQLVWSWGPGELSRQHHPTLLKNGNILIFDNGFCRKFSRIVEVNPLTGKIVWKYISDPPKNFWSSSRGASQRLPNGNTLITESDKGHTFEITKEGKVIWEFYNPNVVNERGKREVIYRMMRITPEDIR